MLKHLFIAFAPLMTLVSACSDQYNIMGNSSVATYDGNVLYLKVMSADHSAYPYDSSEVIHGKFGFEGIIDTVCMAQIFLDDSSLLPIVLESGEIQISFTDAGQSVRGGTLNERLYKFLNENARLQNELQDNTRAIARMIMDEESLSSHEPYERKSALLQDKLDKLWTDFISDNNDNLLGPIYFMEYTSQYFYPVITPQIDKIIKRAPQSFLRNPDVQNYLRDARFNMKLMQGDF